MNKSKSKKFMSMALTLLLTLFFFLTACTNANDTNNLATTPTPIEATQTPTNETVIEVPQAPASEPDTEEPIPPDEPIESDIVQRVLQELTKPEYGGRVTGSEGIILAAQYLTGVFEEIGLMPLNSDTFIMEYSNIDPGIHIFNPNNFSNAKGYNIVGIIPGKDRTKALVISAHYDAVSIGGGVGALDNASGVAAILRIAENILRWGEQPETDIIFCAFDGEEIGLAGSQAFVLNAKGVYQELFNINIDTIGLSGFPLNLVGDEKSIILREDIAGFFNDNGILSENLIGTLVFGSDDKSFSNHGFSATTIGQFNDAFFIMHTENDVLAVLDFALIENIADVLTDFIIELGKN